MASPGKKTIFASEGQKARMETHQVAVVLGHRGAQIVEPKLACDATHETERLDMTANERFEALAVCELQIQLAAVTFHQTESVEFSYMPLIAKRPEVSPVDFEAFSGPRFHAYVGARGTDLRAHSVQVLFQNPQTAAEAERPEPLCDHRGRGLRILLKELNPVGVARNANLVSDLTIKAAMKFPQRPTREFVREKRIETKARRKTATTNLGAGFSDRRTSGIWDS